MADPTVADQIIVTARTDSQILGIDGMPLTDKNRDRTWRPGYHNECCPTSHADPRRSDSGTETGRPNSAGRVVVSIIGLTLEHGEHPWEVTSVRREGPEYRITLRSARDQRCRLIAYVEGPAAPQTPQLRHALATARYRSFVDNQDRVWRAEISPRYELGTLQGNWLVFSAEDGPDRAKFPYDGEPALGLVPEIKLLEFLLRARKAP